MSDANPMHMPHVLLVDDDVELVILLSAFLTTDGFRVSLAHEGESAMLLLLTDPPDIAVIDVMMPGASGIDVLRRIRARSSLPGRFTPIRWRAPVRRSSREKYRTGKYIDVLSVR